MNDGAPGLDTPDHRAVQHTIDPIQFGFDVLGKDIFSALSDDPVAPAALQEEITILIQPADIPRAQPLALESVRGQFGPSIVAGHDHGAPHQNLAIGSQFQVHPG